MKNQGKASQEEKRDISKCHFAGEEANSIDHCLGLPQSTASTILKKADKVKDAGHNPGLGLEWSTSKGEAFFQFTVY